MITMQQTINKGVNGMSVDRVHVSRVPLKGQMYPGWDTAWQPEMSAKNLTNSRSHSILWPD